MTASLLKFPGLSSIQVDLTNVVVWMLSTDSLISKSYSPLNNFSVIVSRAPVTIDTNITFMFHSFSNSLAMSRYLSFSFSLGHMGQQCTQSCQLSLLTDY